MKAKTIREIKSGAEYNDLFPRANLTETTVKRGAKVSDTVKFIPKVVQLTKWQTEKVAEKLKGGNLNETCKNIWEFLYQHIRYHKDQEGYEQVRSPARSWHDREKGIDCDCFTVIACTLLLNCGVDIGKIRLRITKYKEDHFQHIYPIILTEYGNYITLDCVVDEFDYEEPYSEKQDTKMDLQYLDGLSEEKSKMKTVDAQDLFGDEEELGKGVKKEKDKKEKKGKLKNLLKNGLHLTNKLNPATIPLRNGLLASMKLNMFKIPQRLKYAYLSEDEAKKRGIDMDKWKKLVKIKDKMEKIFFGAGGKPENLKKAILKGKGNKDHEIAGVLGMMPEGTVFEMSERTPLPQLIGKEMYDDENEDSTLGDPVTAASVGAVSGILAAISGLLKNIGSIFPKKTKGSEDFENTDKSDDEAINLGKDKPNPMADDTSKDDSASDKTTSDDSKTDDTKTDSNLPAPTDDSSKTNERVANTDKTADTSTTDTTNTTDDPKKPDSFWEKNKKWLKPTLWTAGSLTGLSLLYAGYKAMTKTKEEPKQVLSGLKSKKKKKSDKKKTIALM